jgi:hypothetical protein
MKSITILFIFSLMLCSDFSSAQRKKEEKTACACGPEAWVMIPYGGGTRLGWFNVGIINEFSTYFVPLGIGASVIVDYNTFTGNHNNRILNPLSIGGLPTTFPGPSTLTGMSGNPNFTSSPSTGYSFFFSATMTVGGIPNHYLIGATKLPGATDFTVNFFAKISASFAPAASGWTLHHIEAENSTSMWGIFTNGSQSYLVRFGIPVVSGSTTTAFNMYYWPIFTNYFMDLFNGRINIFELSTATYESYNISTSTMSPPISVPLSSLISYPVFDNFIYNGSFYPNNLYRDGDGIRNSISGPIVTNTLYILNNMSSIGMTISPLNFYINDSGHQW